MHIRNVRITMSLIVTWILFTSSLTMAANNVADLSSHLYSPEPLYYLDDHNNPLMLKSILK